MAGSRTYVFFSGVVVPAVLGNTVWALVQVLVSTSWGSATLPQVASLAMLSLFFLADWIDDSPSDTRRFLSGGRVKWFIYVTATTLFYVICASLAIQIANPFGDWLQLSAALLFLITAIGQFFGIWSEVTGTNQQESRRVYSQVTNIISLIILLICWCFIKPIVDANGALSPIGFYWVIALTLFVAMLPHLRSLIKRW